LGIFSVGWSYFGGMDHSSSVDPPIDCFSSFIVFCLGMGVDSFDFAPKCAPEIQEGIIGCQH
jgi:hypothetical protein